MTVVNVIALSYGPFVLSGLSISHAAWPKLRQPLKLGCSLVLGLILLIPHYFLLATTPAGATVLGLSLCALIWFAVGLFTHATLGGSPILRPILGLKKAPVISSLSGLRLKQWIGIMSFIALIVAFLLIPLLADLRLDLVWRYRAYMAAMAGVALIGAYTRRKLHTVFIGLGLVLLISLVAWVTGLYSVGMPLSEANSLIQEGFQAELPVLDEGGIRQAMGILSTFALASDAVVALLAVAFIGVSAVVLTNIMAERGSGRTVLSLVLVLILLIPGLLIPYTYALGVGGLEFGGSLGLGALRGLTLGDTVQKGELTNETLQGLKLSLVSAGESFERSELLLKGLERLRLFDFMGILPLVGKYSQAGRYIAWGLTNAANGLQISAMGVMDILNAIFIVFDDEDIGDIGSFDLLGPRLVDEEIDEALVAEGILRIDSAFSHVRKGFPRIRSSIGNFSKVDPKVFEDRFPDISTGLEELLANTDELETGIDVADIFLSDKTNSTPATHFIYAAYSLAQIAPNLTDLRDVTALPKLDNVLSNLTFVDEALSDPVIIQIRSEGGDVGDSVSFVADAIDLIEGMADLGDHAIQIAEDIEVIKERFGEKQVYNLTDVEIAEWTDQATVLTEYAEDLNEKILVIEGKIDSMLAKAMGEEYGYANELAGGGIDMLKQILEFLKELKGLSDLSYGIRSLVFSVSSFNDFHNEMLRLERQVEAGNLEVALLTAGSAKKRLREGRMQTEDLLTRLEDLSQQIQLPITTEDVGSIVDAAATIELKMSNLETQLSEGNQALATYTLSLIKEDFSILAEQLQLEGRLP